MKKNEFEILYIIKRLGNLTVRDIALKLNISVGSVFAAKKSLTEKGYLNDLGITAKGLEALAPYKVDNAIIMAAGMSSRFLPISLEKPKGLLVVKGEVLIERQIEQLLEAGISDIIIVLGYKKESFFYLQDKYPTVRFVINPEYNVKNNTHTLALVKDELKNSYICSSDNYFSTNPFDDYAYTSYYSSELVSHKEKEWYMTKGSNDRITSISKSGDDGYIMIGHAYWNSEFSKKMVEILKANEISNEYDSCLWEDILKDKLKELPMMTIKVYPNDTIFEFDSLDELRKFDKSYVKNTRNIIFENISKILNCDEDEIVDFYPIKEGMTNDSFVFTLRGKKYVYRNPGEGTNAIINRSHEKVALELAKRLDVDPTYIYMDDATGFKISKFIEGFREPDYNSFEDSKRVLNVIKRLHKQKVQVDWEYKPYEEMLELERMVLEKQPIEMKDYNEIKDRITILYNRVKNDGVESRFCHCDFYKPNLLLTKTETILIDWEYSGNADPGVDIAVYIMDAAYSLEDATKFIKEYLEDEFNNELLQHYLAYVAIVSFYWLTWALYREACGAVMGESLYKWYKMAKDYSLYLTK